MTLHQLLKEFGQCSTTDMKREMFSYSCGIGGGEQKCIATMRDQEIVPIEELGYVQFQCIFDTKHEKDKWEHLD